MDVIIMPSTISLIKNLKSDFPQFNFQKSSSFLWSHSDNTVYYTDKKDDFRFLFHELAHALLNHVDYGRDIELIAMESQAWDRAKEIASSYEVVIDDDYIQDNLDTYRDWMHERSTCPSCSANGIQIKKKNYRCLACSHQWHVNEAKTCALRRYSLKT
ncbi:MAG: ImmA/IrrE family metallo-endopeptidase [Candidatus Saccharibacteria bacterium]|nr:ImmA/IrrE family metallo-endopeptidase [Candidatus Saccharibacteria bacterium]